MRFAPFSLALPFVLAACPTPDDAGPPVFESGDTRVEVTLAPFSLRVVDKRSGAVVGESRAGGPGCAPLMVALRPLDDEGRFHRPETPEDGLLWLSSKGARAVGGGAFEVELTDASGKEQGEARLTLAVDREGFVRADVAWPFRDTEIAMAGACFALTEREHVVGGGERFDGVDLTGRTIPLAFAVPGPFASGTNESHAPVPFFATTRGLSVLAETERVGAFDVGDRDPSALALRFHGESLPLRLRAGAIVESAAANARYLGLPPPPPRWALAPMQWRNEHEVTVEGGQVVSTGRDRFLDDARTLRALDIPTTTMWIDAPWSTGHNTFTFNEVQFPEPQSMLDEADALGYRVIVWSTEHVNRSDDSGQQVGMPPYGSRALFQRFENEGWLVENGNGAGPFVFPWARGEGGHVDFSHPGAVSAWQELMTPLLERGVRGFKLDFGETMRADLLGVVANDLVSFHDGSTTAVMHTRYARLYHEAFLGALERVHPGDHFVITRTGGLYDQRNGVALWPGDLENDLSRAGDLDKEGEVSVGGLPAAISGALSSSLSGYPLYGSDIGGYRGGPPTGEVLLRWAEFAALSTIMQLGGGGTGDATHNPWDPRYGEGAVDVYRRYARLHMDLLPTFEALVDKASTDGTPVLVPLGVYMGDDEEAWADREAFLVGEHLVAYPVVEEGASSRAVRLPSGTWLDWWTGAAFTGPLSETVSAPLETLPLFFRAGAVVVLGDPRLMTAVDASDDSVADAERYGALRVLRTSAGEEGRATGKGLEAHQRSEGARVTVTATSDAARDVVVDLWLRDEQGPGPGAALTAGGTVPDEVASAEAFWSCGPPCALRAEGRILVRARGQDLTFRFEGR